MSLLASSVRRNIVRPYLNLITFGTSTLLFLCFLWIFIEVSRDRSGVTSLFLLMLIQLTPAVITFSRGGFNYIVFIMLNHFLTYSVAKYNLIVNLDKTSILTTDAQNAVREMIYSSLLIISMYYFTRYLFFRTGSERRQFTMLQLTPRGYFWLGMYVVCQPLVSLYVPGELFTMHILSSGLATVMIFCSYVGAPLLERWMKAAVIAAGLYAFLTQGSLTMFVNTGMLLFMVAFIQWRLKNFLILVAMFIAGVLFQSVKAEYRILSRTQDMNVAQEALALSDLIADRYLGGEDHSALEAAAASQFLEEELDDGKSDMDAKESLSRGFARVGDDSLERVLSMTPNRVPFWNGETYTHIPYIFIPRILWHGKPKRELWHKFGKLYGYLGDDDTETSVGVNFLGEAYMNFGYLGLYTVACLFGIIIALWEWISFIYLPKATYFVFICFLLPFMNYGLDMGSIVNGMAIVGASMLFVRTTLSKLLLRDSYV